MRVSRRELPVKENIFVIWMTALVLAGVAVFLMAVPAHSEESKSDPVASAPAAAILLPQLNADRGRRLFVDRACVVCHAVDGVGGKAGPSFDAVGKENHVDVLDFAARMWRGADPMIVLQAMELGYQIELTGQDIGDLAAFAQDKNAQKGFSMEEVPDLIRDWFVDDPVEYAPEGQSSEDQLTE